jgi:hypothetical protein
VLHVFFFSPLFFYTHIIDHINLLSPHNNTPRSNNLLNHATLSIFFVVVQKKERKEKKKEKKNMLPLRAAACRITLFTRANCGLCAQAKDVLGQVAAVRPFALREVDVVRAENRPWRDLYDFDVPVIHVSRAVDQEEDPAQAHRATKLMHRFSVDEVNAVMDVVGKS